MPKSKTRKTAPAAPAKARQQGRPHDLPSATSALLLASLEIVREAELHITAAARAGDAEGLAKATEVHHYLRTSALGIMVAHATLNNLPDPRAAAPTA